jgi:alpha-N-arabinofuranosidase
MRCARMPATTSRSLARSPEPGGPAWRQSIFHPYALTARHARGEVLRVEPVSPVIGTARHGEVARLSAVATLDEDEVTLPAVNRSADRPLEVTADVRDVQAGRLIEALTLAEDDPHRIGGSTEEVRPRPLGTVRIDGGSLTTTLPPASWNMVRLGRRA